MLNVNPETICFIIAKARQFHAKEEVTIPEIPNSPAEDWARQVLADHSDDPCFQEIRATIFDLEPDQMIELVALMWRNGTVCFETWAQKSIAILRNT
jgi:hypothetical protein